MIKRLWRKLFGSGYGFCCEGTRDRLISEVDVLFLFALEQELQRRTPSEDTAKLTKYAARLRQTFEEEIKEAMSHEQ